MRPAHNRLKKVRLFHGPPELNIIMEHNKKPVDKFYYSEKEWDRLGCGPLPKERNITQRHQDACAKGNPKVDGKVVKGYN